MFIVLKKFCWRQRERERENTNFAEIVVKFDVDVVATKIIMEMGLSRN